MIDYSDSAQRLRVIHEINSDQNQDRKTRSLKECEIYNDDIRPYVKQYLRTRFNASTVEEMPIIASINLAKKIVTQEASIYSNSPVREWTNLTDDQKEKAQLIYDDMMADFKLMQANRFYRLQQQHHVKIFPMGGKLCMRNYKNHHIDAEPSDDNPEQAQAYIFSGFDKFMQNDERQYLDGDFSNSKLADEEDYKSKVNKYVVWTPQYHFSMDANGKVIGENPEDVLNPLWEYGLMPVIDIANLKDFEYFQSYGNALTDFTIEFCGHLSSLAMVVDLQGYAQAILSGPPELLPRNLTVGPNHIIYLPSDPSLDATTSFEFANPSPDISGSQNYVESLLSMFLSSRGVDPKAISGNANGQDQYSSGIERLLAMIEKFEATREDYSLFERVEDKLWTIIKAWHNTLRDTDQLDEKYKTQPFPEDSEVQVKFARPEMVTTEKEKLEAIQLKMDLGIISQRMAVKEFHDVDDERVDEIMEEIAGEMNANNQDQDELLSGFEQETRGLEQERENES